MTYSNANFAPSLKGYSNVKPFRFWCQKVLPLVYDDSLSYYELLCKVVDYLNNVISDLSATEDNVGDLLTAYNQLQDYVNNYFTNLDVQEEINNKLDDLVEDGTLTRLIGNYIQPRIDEINEELDNYKTEMNANFNGLQSATESNLQQQNDKIFVLEGRMDTFTQLTPGSTTGDAELQDIRVAYDGTVFPTAGDAVRGQVSNLKNALNSNLVTKEDLIGIYNKTAITPEAYGYNIVDNKISSQASFYHLTYQIPSGTKVVGVSGYHATEKQALYGFYDSNDNLLDYEKDSSSAVSYPDMIVVPVPENATKLIVNVGTYTDRGIFLFTKYDVIPEIETRVNYAESQSLTDEQKVQARKNIGAYGADDVEFALQDKQDIIGTFVKADITPTSYGYNIVENKNSSQASFYHVVYEIPEGTVVVGVNGYHVTEKQALWGFYDSNDNLLEYEQDSRSAISYPDVITVLVPENAVKLIVNIGTYTSRGVHVFTQMDVANEVVSLKSRTSALETQPVSVYPIVFPPTSPYVYDGSSITEDFITGTGDMLTPYYALFDALVTAYPNHISSEVIGRDESDTYDIKAYTICQYSTISNKPVILWFSDIHASEPYTLTATYALVKELLTNHDNDNVLGFIWRNCTMKVVPVCNPWGLANGGQRYNSNGVNINRDFPVDWEYSDDQYDKTGDTPASQAETQALMAYVNANKTAIFTVTKHDSNAYTEANGKIAYTVDNFKVDMNVIRANNNLMNMMLLNKYTWIKSNRSSADYVALFNNLSTNATHGSMNKWFNSIGVHGCLFEVTRPKVGDYTEDKVQDFIQINLELSANLIASAIQQNGLIRSNNEVWNQY